MTAALVPATRPRRRAWLRTWLLAAAVAVTVSAAILASAAPAEATTLAIALNLGTLTPDVAATATATVDVPVTARVVTARWDSITGLDSRAEWSAELCLGASCIPMEQLAGRTLAPGSWQLRVTAVLQEPVVALAATTGEADGDITLIETGEGLAYTGLPPWLTVVGAVLLTAGGLLSLGGRRRRA